MTRLFLNRVILAGLLLLFWSQSAPAVPAAPASAAKTDRNKLIDIKSDQLYTDNVKRTATFTSKVVARQDDLTVYSDKLIVYYAEGSGEVEKLEADGNVRIVQKNSLGTGGHAVYDLKLGTIVLTINPKVQKEKDYVVGDVITHYVDKEQSVVTSAPGVRVHAEINPKGSDRNAGGK